ncbi:unnamed protein product [Paramecium primaurelia]|uniref:Transmembrane protein n=1 Tax=Paramecium primaurelia TaxID=5886 RepID=A0A8S1QAE1_PARPR|nr:unnamed protein product [Paramecium primaurelia]
MPEIIKILMNYQQKNVQYQVMLYQDALLNQLLKNFQGCREMLQLLYRQNQKKQQHIYKHILIMIIKLIGYLNYATDIY